MLEKYTLALLLYDIWWMAGATKMQLPQARWASPLTLSAKRAKNI